MKSVYSPEAHSKVLYDINIFFVKYTKEYSWTRVIENIFTKNNFGTQDTKFLENNKLGSSQLLLAFYFSLGHW